MKPGAVVHGAVVMKNGFTRRLVLGLALAFWPSVGFADDYDEALQAAEALQKAGRWTQAAQALEHVAANYPQDLMLQLRMGFFRFNGQDYDQALVYYQTALRLSPGSLDAQLGLGWTLVRLNRCAEARFRFQAVLSQQNDHAGAKEGLLACPVPPTLSAQTGVLLTGMAYGQHYQRQSGLAVSPRVELLFRGQWLFGAAYRYSDFFLQVRSQVQVPQPPRPGFPPQPPQWRTVTSSTSFDQHEAYGYAGYAGPRLSVVARYAFLIDARGSSEASHHTGLGVRLNLARHGEGQLDSAASVYRDLTVLRVAPRWKIPVYQGFAVTVGGVGQWASGTVLGNGWLELGYVHPRISLYVGGAYGEQIRPAQLEYLFITNMFERVAASAWGGSVLLLPRDFRILFEYRYDRLARLPDVADSIDSNAHYFTFGLHKAF